MNDSNRFVRIFVRILSYILVAAIAACVTFFALINSGNSKLNQLRSLISNCFIGEVTEQQLNDGAAAGMVAATGDKWSYYIPAADYDAHMASLQNEYVGIGVTISTTMTETGIEILEVDPQGGAYEAGIQAGDIICRIGDQSAVELGIDGSKVLIQGDANTQVEVAVLRDGTEQTFQVARKRIKVIVAQGQMLPGNIGLVIIANFDERCADESIAAIESLMEQGATALIFDVRFNPGGFKTELVELLDYLLPEGPVFRSVNFRGQEEISESDAKCLDIPMAVLLNESSYSAAEFFGAALREYDKAILVGTPTTGKSYFQNTYQLSDGSAVGLSVGKYCTPKGVSLAEVGGLKPDVEVPVEDEILRGIYAGTLKAEDDPQIQAAIAALQK